MTNIDKEKRETARVAHKDIFDRCQFAIESGFYLEAILLEYAAMEARMKVIMSLFKKPCSLCEDTSITHGIGLRTKTECFRNIIENNPSLFKDSKFTREKASKMMQFCASRNTRVHGLLEDTESYNKLMQRSAKTASQGYDLLKLLYTETNRLKRIAKKHPEMLSQANLSCFSPDDKNCLKAKEWTEHINKEE